MSHKREWKRNQHSKRLTLELSKERRIEGYTQDVSLGGLFMTVANPNSNIVAGEIGTLHLLSGSEPQTFPCKVIRVAKKGLALALTDQMAQFGLAISHDIFHQMLSERKD